MKKAECQRTDVFKLWCWTARRTNQSILKEINPEYSPEGLMLKLWPPDAKSQLTRKDLDAGKDISLSKLWKWWSTGKPGYRSWGLTVGHNWETEHHHHHVSLLGCTVLCLTFLLSDCVSWDHFPNKLLVPKSLDYGLILGKEWRTTF